MGCFSTKNMGTNLGHGGLALEATADPVVDTLGLPPCLLYAVVPIRLVALEFVGALFDDGDLDGHRSLQDESETSRRTRPIHPVQPHKRHKSGSIRLV
jgi:hypothetical protein